MMECEPSQVVAGLALVGLFVIVWFFIKFVLALSEWVSAWGPRQ